MRQDGDLARLRGARVAVFVVFVANGLMMANWVSRVPALRDAFHLSPRHLGLVLLCLSLGAVLALPLAGTIVSHLGPARAVVGAGSLSCAGVIGIGLAPRVPLLMLALFTTGLGAGIWDVAMNVEGADVERRLGVHLMPALHGAFSLGTVAGAGMGAAAAAGGLPVAVHLPVVGGLVCAALLAGTRRFLPVAPARHVGRRWVEALAAWREPRTVAIGVMVLGMAFSEGAANDWLAVGLVDSYAASQAIAAAGFGVFVTAMTLGRFTGPIVLGRLGRVTAVRAGAGLVCCGITVVIAGVGLVATSQVLALAVAATGALAWGVGTALGFPIGMSAAADDPRWAATRVSVVSTIGYTAFLAGPPSLGLLADHVGVIHALAAVVLAVAVSFAVAGAARPHPASVA